jgi:glutaredoxin 3
MSAPKIIMYTQPFCGFCAAARALFKKKGVTYEDVDIGRNPELREKMIKLSGRTTVPQIFINDEHIGGYDDMAALDQAGDLDPRLGL